MSFRETHTHTYRGHRHILLCTNEKKNFCNYFFFKDKNKKFVCLVHTDGTDSKRIFFRRRFSQEWKDNKKNVSDG